MRRGALALALTAPSAAFAQATAPSSITPSTLRPDAVTEPPPAIAPPAKLAPPRGSAALMVRLSGVDVQGDFAEASAETTAIVRQVVGRRITLGELYAAATAIEAAHIRRGFLLVRAVVPPQSLVDGGVARIVIVDGFIERIDGSGVPARARAAALGRVGAIAGQHHLQLHDIEQPLVLAGAVPGLRLQSTLSAGTATGGTVLTLSGKQSLVTGSLAIDNGYAASLGRYAVTAQVSLNSLFGRGEQFYALGISGYDPRKAFGGAAPIRVLGGGGVFTTPDGRLYLNPEATFSRTQPMPAPGVPTTRGTLTRLSIRGGYVVARTRRRSIGIAVAVEHVSEANDAIDFAARLSLDRFTVGRTSVTFSSALRGGGGVSASAQFSHGLAGLAPSGPNAPSVSRQGADPAFAKAVVTVQIVRPIAAGWTIEGTARGQTSFGQALFRSEQGALEGPDGLSAYSGGVTAVDSFVSGRVEIAHDLAVPAPFQAVRLSPYLFTAAGIGKIERPTAVEAPSYDLESAGVGLRGVFGRSGIAFALEYARGLSSLWRLDNAERLSASTSVRF